MKRKQAFQGTHSPNQESKEPIIFLLGCPEGARCIDLVCTAELEAPPPKKTCAVSVSCSLDTPSERQSAAISQEPASDSRASSWMSALTDKMRKALNGSEQWHGEGVCMSNNRRKSHWKTRSLTFIALMMFCHGISPGMPCGLAGALLGPPWLARGPVPTGTKELG